MSTWGKSWGIAWGNSWGAVVQPQLVAGPSSVPGGSGGDSGRIRFRNERPINTHDQVVMVRTAIAKAREETAERLAREREERRSKKALAKSAKPSAPTSLSKFMKMKDVTGYAKPSPYSQALKLIKH